MAEPQQPQNPGAPFEIIGRMEVDLDALRRSLASAEEEARRSGERFDRIMSGEGPGAGGQRRDPFRGLSEGSRRSSQELRRLSTVAQALLRGPFGQLSPEVARLTSVLGTGARSMAGFGVGLGAAFAGAAVASQIVAQLSAEAERSTKAAMEADRAYARLDFSRAAGQAAQSAEKIGDLNFRVRQLRGEVESTWWQRLQARFAMLSDTISGSTRALLDDYQRAAQAAARVAREVEVPGFKIDERRARAEAIQREARLEAEAAQSAEDLAEAHRKEAVQLAELARIGRDALDLEERRAKAALMSDRSEILQKMSQDLLALQREAAEAERKIDALSKTAPGEAQAWQNRLRQLREDIATSSRQMAAARAAGDELLAVETERFATRRRVATLQEFEESIQLGERQRREVAKRVADEESYFQRESNRQAERERLAIGVAGAQADADERVRQLRRDMVGDVERLLSLEVRLVDERDRALDALSAEEDAARRALESRRRTVEAQIAAGVDLVKNRLEAADLERQAEHDRERFALRRAETLAKLDAEAEQRYQARERAEVSQEERRFRHAVEMGRLTLEQEVRFQQAAARDPRRGESERFAAAQAAQRAYVDLVQSSFRLRQRMGQETLREELSFEERLTATRARGSREWFEGLERVAELTQRVRDQYRQISDTILGIGAQALRQDEIEEGTLDDVQRAFERQRERDREVIERALVGGRVKFRELLDAIQREEQYRMTDRFPFTDAFSALAGSLRNPERAFEDAMRRVDAAGERSLPRSLEGAGDKLSLAADKLVEAAREMTVRWESAQVVPQASLGDKLGREIFLQGRRGPNTAGVLA